jgi:glyoxylase-like metal-dependent hydrolase (beta-lactamase superfamily II)
MPAARTVKCRAVRAPSPLTPGVVVSLAPGVRRLVAGNAGLMTGPGTNTYLLGTGEIAVLDPGPPDERHLQCILEAAAGSIRWVLVTHTHRDHSPLAARLAEVCGATLLGLAPPGDGRQDVSFRPGREPCDGERLAIGDSALTVIHTPGHASNCVCYLHEHERLLFTGDHVLEGVTPVILPPDGDMSAYMKSIDKLEALAFERIAPGHGGLIERGKHMLVALRTHRLKRESKVIRCLEGLGPRSLEELTPAVYDDVPPERHAWARLTLEAHLIKLVRDGRASETNGRWQLLAR